MATGDSFRTVSGENLGVRQAFAYLGRAALLRCPVCGTRPIFLPVRRVRNFDDWFSPLDGCPRCGYAYEREAGYFLLAIFGFNFGFAVFVGIAVFVYLAEFHELNDISTWQLIASTVLPIPLVNLLVARHAKALFIALDHFVDPHVHHFDDGSDSDDDDGTHLVPTPPAGGSGGVDTPDDGGGHVPWKDPEESEAAVRGEAALSK